MASRRIVGWVRFLGIACLLVGMLVSAHGPVAGAGVVGDGTPGSCTEAALITAMGGGGMVTFDCGPAPHTIVITTPGGIIPSTSTTIDGGGLVTLSGNNATRIFRMLPGSDLTIRNMTLANGNAGNAYGGGIYNERGTLLLENVTVQNCATNAGFAGGGIDNNNGQVTLRNSLVQGNTSPFGGGIDSVGRLTIVDSVIRNNSATTGLGGGLDVGGQISVTGSLIEGNSALQGGGGINATSASNMTIRDSRIADNTSPGSRLASAGGGILNAGVLTLRRVTVSGNAAGNGGGIYNNAPNGLLTIGESTISGNAAQVHGGGMLGAAGNSVLNNVTYSGNTAQGGGGAIYQYGGYATVAHSTFSDNHALYAGAIYRDADGGGAVRLGRTLLAGNDEGNCGGSIDSDGYNLADDTYCGLEFPTDAQSVDPLLGPLADNGGPTQTHSLGEGSPAIDAVPEGGCPATDQRGVLRPQGAACDIGAVEVNPDAPSSACGGVYPAMADTTLFASQPDQPFGAEGYLRLGLDVEGEQRILLAFDLAAHLSEGAIIQQAFLELDLLDPPTPVPYQIELREVSSAWDEATAT